jgi:hypothetical protein
VLELVLDQVSIYHVGKVVHKDFVLVELLIESLHKLEAFANTCFTLSTNISIENS